MDAVEAELFYLSTASKTNRRYVAPGAELNTGVYEPHRVIVRNARPLGDQISLDSHGFVLAQHASAIADFRDKAAVDAHYPREVEEVVKGLTGADFVVPMGWVLRTSGPTNVSVQPPATDVHVDMTHDRAHRFAHKLFEQAREQGIIGARGFRRFVATSLWRSFSAPPQDWPLTVCDSRSVAPDEGVPNLMVRVPELPRMDALPPEPPDADSLPAAYVFHYRPDHRWWYFPNMTRDEVILLKFHDSDHSRAWRVPHTAFRDRTFSNPRMRESIEFRTVAYFQ